MRYCCFHLFHTSALHDCLGSLTPRVLVELDLCSLRLMLLNRRYFVAETFDNSFCCSNRYCLVLKEAKCEDLEEQIAALVAFGVSL